MVKLKLVAPSGNVYEGNVPVWSDMGMFKCQANGCIYFGQFKGGIMHGLAEFFFANGDVHRGMYVDNWKQEPGVFVWRDGEQFSGDFMSDKRHGFGEQRFVNGNQYIGEWSYDKRHGKGRFITKSGEVRDRIWVNGKETSKPCDVKDVLENTQNSKNNSAISIHILYLPSSTDT